MSVPKRVRQAVVIVHGMGEQRPLDMLNKFIKAAIPGASSTAVNEKPIYYSRPDEASDSYESRRMLAPDTDFYAQTEFFEYHWAHLMQGNQLGDMWETTRRMLLQLPWKVPSGLRFVWLIFWILIIYVPWYLLKSDFDLGTISVEAVITALAGSGLTATILVWLLTKYLPGKICSSFVDVVRYLDTSPRSYAVRKDIRQGMIDFLQKLHDKGRYQRIIVVAHSLGAYVAYDGITYLWTNMNQKHCADHNGEMDAGIRQKLEYAAQYLLDGSIADPQDFRNKQRQLWQENRKQGNPWLITDFITLGTPMYMADQLYTKNRKDFDSKIKLRHLATCPPQPDLPGSTPNQTLYTYPYNNGPVLYHAAPFALVRWTNMWFPAHFSFFGDWFGGPLRPLFGNGILDIKLTGNKPKRLIPAMAHTFYFSFPDDVSENSVTKKLHDAMELNSKLWLEEMLTIEECPEDAKDEYQMTREEIIAVFNTTLEEN